MANNEQRTHRHGAAVALAQGRDELYLPTLFLTLSFLSIGVGNLISMIHTYSTSSFVDG